MTALAGMGDTGLEPHHVTTGVSKDLANSAPTSAAESGAVRAQAPVDDPDLATVMSVWPSLPEAVRVGIMAMVQAAEKGVR